MAAVNYCSTSDVINMFPAAANAPAPQLLLALNMASAYVENYTQRILWQTTYVHEQSRLIVNRDNQLVGKVRQWPVNSVTALSFLRMGDQVTPASELALDVNYVDFLTPPERLFYYSGSIPSRNSPSTYATNRVSKSLKGILYVTYNAGFNPIPDDVKNACILLTQYFLTRNANALGAASISVSATSSTNSISFARRSTLLDDSEQILNAYVRRE